MRKMPTMYSRDESIRGHPAVPGVKEECAWVEAGEGIATHKLDGTNVKIERGILHRRQKPKDRDYDDAAYVVADPYGSNDKWIFQGLAKLEKDNPLECLSRGELDGVYEAVGPKIQRNTQRLTEHELVRVVPVHPDLELHEVPRDFEGLKNYLAEEPVEGIVFHHPDGRVAKIKRRDFGIPWPPKEEVKW